MGAQLEALEFLGKWSRFDSQRQQAAGRGRRGVAQAPAGVAGPRGVWQAGRPGREADTVGEIFL
jgi:hypothetical protein